MNKILNAITPKQKIIDQLLSSRQDNDEAVEPAVLPADHPLLEKFQKALKAHLLKVKSELTDEISSLDFKIHNLNKERDEIGSTLYDYQAEIERQKDTLDQYNEQFKDLSEKRQKHERNTLKLKKECDNLNYDFKEAKRSYNENLMELAHVQVLENNVSKWTQEIDDEVRAAKRIVSKDHQNELAISQEKKQMDLILFNLDDEVRRREKELYFINNEVKEQQEVIEMLNCSISDANADLNALQTEHNRLIGTWSEVITTIQQRDKVLAKMRDNLETEKQHQKVLKSHILGIKKSTAKEMEQNEKLEAFKIRLSADISSLEKQLEKETEDHTKLLEKMSSMNSVLEKSESDLSKANMEGQIIENHLKSLRKQLDRQSQQKIVLEERTLELLQDQITTDQASSYRGKVLRQVQEKRRTMELSMFDTEQQLSQVLFDLEKWKNQVTISRGIVERLTKERDEETKKVNKINAETNAMKTMINMKYKAFDSLNKELMALVEAAGGQEMDPKELKLMELETTVNDLNSQIRESQNFWLRLQGHIVSLTEKRSQQLNDIQLSRKQLLVIEQKTLKIDAQLDEIKKQDIETKRKFKALTQALDKLSAQLFEKKLYHENNEAECEYKHSELLDKLKNEEMSVLQLQKELNDRTAEIEQTKTLVMEKHRESLSWETKWKMATETYRSHQAEYAAASEIGIMKAEIHRMEVRYMHLKRAQEKLVHDMENCVMHREHIFDGANIRGKIPDSKTKSRFTIQHRLNEMRNKLKHISNDSSGVERNINELTKQKSELIDAINRLTQDIENERVQDSLLLNEIEQAALLKQENLENIVRIQQRAKRYRNLVNAKQLPKCRSEIKLSSDQERQEEINNHLISVLESLLTEYPNHKTTIVRVLQTLKIDGAE